MTSNPHTEHPLSRSYTSTYVATYIKAHLYLLHQYLLILLSHPGGHKGICVRSIGVDQYSKYIHTNSHVLSMQLGTVVWIMLYLICVCICVFLRLCVCTRPKESCSKNSSLFYSKFPKKSLHYACNYYSFYAPHCCHYPLICTNLQLSYSVKHTKQSGFSYVCMFSRYYITTSMMNST